MSFHRLMISKCISWPELFSTCVAWKCQSLHMSLHMELHLSFMSYHCTANFAWVCSIRGLLHILIQFFIKFIFPLFPLVSLNVFAKHWYDIQVEVSWSFICCWYRLISWMHHCCFFLWGAAYLHLVFHPCLGPHLFSWFLFPLWLCSWFLRYW